MWIYTQCDSLGLPQGVGVLPKILPPGQQDILNQQFTGRRDSRRKQVLLAFFSHFVVAIRFQWCPLSPWMRSSGNELHAVCADKCTAQTCVFRELLPLWQTRG